MAVLDQFILFGDSLTQGASDQSKGFGLAAELQHAYIRRLDVINRGFSGYTTDHALSVLSRVLPEPHEAKIEFLTIWLGANDANKNPAQNQFVPAERFKGNLHAILGSPVVKAHNPKIILLTTPPFEENVLIRFRDNGGYTGPVRKAADAREYAELVKEVGKEAGIDVLDIWTLFMNYAGGYFESEPLPGSEEAGLNQKLEELLTDGLHLSPAGYKVVYDGLVSLIEEKWPNYPPYKMPFAVKESWEIEMGD